MGKDVRTLGYQAFANCSALSEINLTDRLETFANKAYSDRAETFLNCTSLTSIILGKRVSTMYEGVFSGCTGLTTVDIHDGCEVIGTECFYGCTALQSIDIPESVTSIGANAFWGCEELKKATIGDGVVTIGTSAFQDCKKLATLTLGEGLTTINYRAFYGCESLSSVVIPDYVSSIPAKAYSDNAETFANCKNLQSVTLGKRIETMGYGVFSGCVNITKVEIKNGCKVIGAKCFDGCNDIKTIVNNCVELPETAANAFSDYSAALYVPEESFATYKATEPWSKFGSIGTIEGGVIEPATDKCATPTIKFAGGELTFECETEGVEFVYDIKDDDVSSGSSSQVKLACTYHVNVYAKKAGMENSETATYTIDLLKAGADVNGDGIINAADIVSIVNIIREAE